MGMDAAPLIGVVYGLIDPRDGTLRYVGQTITSLKSRLLGHCEDCGVPTRKGRWIAELDSLGLQPQIVELGVFPIRKLDAEEIATISSVRAAGGDLCNISPGGGRPLRRRKRHRREPQWDRCLSRQHLRLRLEWLQGLQREQTTDLDRHRYAMRGEE